MSTANAGDAETEIGMLIDSVRTSSCIFVRNGSEYTAGDAADHLALKYRRGKRVATSAEAFIDKLASSSSLSGKPYLIMCDAVTYVRVRDWLYQKLQDYRQN